jgi:hypothetical protein
VADSDDSRWTSRRAFLRRAAAALWGAAAAGLAGLARAGRAQEGEAPSGQAQGDAPAPRARLPIDVRERGAAGDGETDDTAAIQRALDEARGGGVVVVPAGRFLVTTLHLRDGVTLRLERGAVLLGHPSDRRYDRMEELPYRTGSDRETSDASFALLSARGVEGVVIEGEGTIDANRDERGGPKPIAMKQCRGVRVRGIRIENSPNYALSLIGCDGVEIEGVVVVNSYSDGIDADCCRSVRIAGCEVESDDDGICLKASLALGERVATEHVVIEGCTVRSASNAVKLGSESSGDFRDVRVRDCTFAYPAAVDVPQRIAEGGGIALEMVDGGALEDVLVERISIAGVPAPIFVRLGNRGREQSPKVPGRLRNVAIRAVRATGASFTSSITGLPEAPAREVRLEDVEIALADEAPGRFKGRLGSIPERPDAYPTPRMFGVLPAAGLYCRHVEELDLRGLRFTGAMADPRPALVAEDLRGGRLEGLRVEATSGAGPIVWLERCRGIALRNARAPAGSGLFLRVSGEESSGIELAKNDLAAAARPLELAPGVAPGAVRDSGAGPEGEQPAAD